MKMKKCILILCLLIFSGLGHGQDWSFEEDFVINHEGSMPHGVVVTPDQKIWVGYYGSTDTIFGEQDTILYPIPIRPIWVFNPDGSLDRKIKFLTFEGVEDTIVNTCRGLSLDNNGNVLFSNWDCLYRINYQTDAVMNKMIPEEGVSITEAACDANGYIYLTYVVPDGRPITIYDSNFDYYGLVDENNSIISRSLAISADGNDLYLGRIYGYTDGGEGNGGIIHYHSDNGPDGPYTQGQTYHSEIWGECLDWDNNGLLWVGSFWNIPEEDLDGWYGLDVSNDLNIVRVLGNNVGINPDEGPQPPPGGTYYSPRGMAWNADGTIIYTADFNGGVIKKWQGLNLDFTTLHDINFNNSDAGIDGNCYPSTMLDNQVKTQGIVLGNDPWGFYVQDGSESWNGIYVYTTNQIANFPDIGDSVIVIGNVDEYAGVTEIINPVVSNWGSANTTIEPVDLTTGLFGNGCDVAAEVYECTLVKLTDVTVTQEANQYGVWYVDDGSGQCPIDIKMFPLAPSVGETFDFIIGVVRDHFGEYKITPRRREDFSPMPVPPVTFQADLTQFINEGWFDLANPADSIVVNGSFNGWNSHIKMVPDEGNPNIYTHTEMITANVGDIIEWKFRMFPIYKWMNSGWEDGNNRTTVYTGGEMVLEAEVPNCGPIEETISQDVTVTFSVNMADAASFQTGEPFENLKSVFMNGDFCTANGWAGWALEDTVNLIRLYDDGATGGDQVADDNVWTTNVLFLAGSGYGHIYKYAAYDPDNMDLEGTNPLDNEAGWGDDHNVVIDDSGPTYIPPTDRWATIDIDEISISDARVLNDGEMVKITGIVTSPNFGTPDAVSEYTIQDATAGIILWANFFDAKLNIGDSVSVLGQLATYSGKREIVPQNNGDVIVLSNGNGLPAFQNLTILELLTDPEAYESELVRILNVTIIDGSWPNPGENSNLFITDNSSDTVFTMRIDKETDVDEGPEPDGAFNIQGIIGQYDSSDPYDDGYQIFPRFHSDFNTITTQDVTITFSVDMSTCDDNPGNVSLQGAVSPLDWNPGSTIMSVSKDNGIYTIDVLFPAGSGRILEFKYTAYYDEQWNWENFGGNRKIEIDDSSPTQVLNIDIWGNPHGKASAYFDGVNDRIRVTDNNPVNPEANPDAYIITGNTISVEAWIFPMSLPEHGDCQSIITRPYWNAEPWMAYELRISNYTESDNPRFEFTMTDGTVPWNGISIFDDTPVPIGEWTHLTGTYDGSMARLYVNGQLVNESAFTSNIGEGTTGLYIGGNWGGYFHGLIDEIRLWNIARTQQEIQDGMTTPPDPQTAGLAGYWPLDGPDEVNGNYPIAIDLTDNHNDLWIQNGVYFVDANPPDGEPNIPPSLRVEEIHGVLDEYMEYFPHAGGWPLPSISLLAGPEGMTVENNVLRWTPNVMHWNEVTLQAMNNAGTVQETFPIWIDGASLDFKEHNNNNISFSVFNNGILGIARGNLGQGFQYNGANGLYEGTLIVGCGNDQVSGVLYNREFSILDSIRAINSQLFGFDQAYQVKFDDQKAPNPIGIAVTQYSHSKSTDPDNDYIIMDFEIQNTSGNDLDNVYIGLEMDWDVGEATMNLGGFDSERKLSYIFEVDGQNNPNYYGITALSDEISGHFLWANGSIGDESSDNFLYQSMQTFNQIPVDPSDLRVILAMGPYNIPAQGVKQAVFGLLGGDDLADLQTNTDAALAVDIQGHTPDLSHFEPVYTGNPYLAMNIYVTSAMLEGVSLEYGDEIGIFDGDVCVGGGVVSGNFSPYFAIVASTDDPSTPEIDGFVANHNISYKFWDFDAEVEITSVIPTYTLGDGTFSSQGSALVGLEGALELHQDISFTAGWNIMSFFTEPNEMNLKNIVQPIIDDNTLLKIQDETGSAIEELPVIGWVDNIGDMSVSEGYYIKLATDNNLELDGTPVTMPYNIGLSSGWNIMGYPVSASQNAMDAFQPLIDEQSLIKVQDETGSAIEELPVIGWIDNIGNLNPGEGYYVKVGFETAITIQHPSKKSQLAKVTKMTRNPAHFIYPSESNPYLAMNIYVLNALLDEQELKEGFEIGVFDNELCVGSAVITQSLKPKESYLPIIVRSDDPLTEEVDGFIPGNSMNFRIWDGNEEFLCSATPIFANNENVSLAFASQGKIAVELSGKTIPKEYKLYNCYPNPFNPMTTIKYDLPNANHVNLNIFDLKGRLVRTLVSENREAGTHELIWNGQDNNGRMLPSGMYFYQLNTSDFSRVKKAIFIK